MNLGIHTIMQKRLILLLALCIAAHANAKEYGSYDTQRLVTVSETPAGKKHSFNVAYLDEILNDLSAHAKNYPPQFDTPQDKQRAARDVAILSGMLDVLIDVPMPNPELLLRAAHVNSMGHNLDIRGAGEKANAIFLRLLAAAPSDPRHNYLYGVFLAGAAKPEEALPYLEKALAGGIVDADYAIGMTRLSLGDKEQALKHLENYRQRKPGGGNIDPLIDAIRNGKMEFKKSAD